MSKDVARTCRYTGILLGRGNSLKDRGEYESGILHGLSSFCKIPRMGLGVGKPHYN